MAVRKEYIIWNTIKVNDNFIKHPNTDNELYNKWKDVMTITEYPYHDDIWYLGHATFDDEKVTQSDFELYFTDYQDFNIIDITVNEVIEWLNNLYGDYFSLNEDGFTFEDNRPIPKEFI